ncbi:hypothetical protein [Streptomyces sp. SBT349]|uniref:hypothetical protein n=1 Tax=Streptomyces sp. SBT349 TaxID=1580539 RepID=UPI00099D1377|nr:hypothetical protein [Streptomyces sp. SBT349]
MTAADIPRFGRVVDRRPHGGGVHGRASSYVVQDEEDGRHYTFDYTHIVTEGFRTLHTGERVRFHTSPTDSWRAEFVIRLDQPDPEVFYE